MLERYLTPELKRLWSNKYKYEIWHKLELLNLEALCRLDYIKNDAVEALRNINTPSHQEILEEEEKTHHDIAAFLNILTKNLSNRESKRFLHFGMTSSDLLDTQLCYTFLQASKCILTELGNLIETLQKLAVKYSTTLQIGRTHGIHAEPTVFGLKLANFTFALHNSYRHLSRLLDEFNVVKFSGAVGNYSNIPREVETYIAEKLAVKATPVATQVIMRDQFANVINTIAVSTSICEAIATDLRHLQRTEVNEVQELFSSGQIGSSAMPHKKNPIISERICGLSRTLRSYVIAAMENIALWHERDISHSSSERIILPDFTSIAHYTLRITASLLANLQINSEQMLKNMELSSGRQYSSKLLSALIESGYTREEAYKEIQSISNELKEGTTLIDAVEKKFGKKLTLKNVDVSQNLEDLFKKINELSLDK
jgi:adenylosuccinate lyase